MCCGSALLGRLVSNARRSRRQYNLVKDFFIVLGVDLDRQLLSEWKPRSIRSSGLCGLSRPSAPAALSGAFDPQGHRPRRWLRLRRGAFRRLAGARAARADPCRRRERKRAGSLTPILARLKRACRLNEDAAAAKARALAREIVNDWEAITAFVTNPNLPPTQRRRDGAATCRHR